VLSSFLIPNLNWYALADKNLNPDSYLSIFDKQEKFFHTALMETVVIIDTEILNKAMQAAVGQTQRQLVEDALRLFTLQNKQNEVRKYRGKLQWEGNCIV
jgi:hypothetical protein